MSIVIVYTYTGLRLTIVPIPCLSIAVLSVPSPPPPSLLACSATVERVNTTDQLSALQKVHPVVFLLIHDGEVDADWERLYTKAAKENVLKGTFFYSLNADILKVSPTHCVLTSVNAYVLCNENSYYMNKEKCES